MLPSLFPRLAISLPLSSGRWPGVVLLISELPYVAATGRRAVQLVWSAKEQLPARCESHCFSRSVPRGGASTAPADIATTMLR